MTDRFASAAGEARFRRRPLAAVLLTASLLPAALHAAEGERLDIQEVIISEEMTLSRETSIGKMDVPVAETPFSVSLRSREFMDSIGAKTVQEALQHFAGVNGGLYGVDARGDWSEIRGVAPTIFVDGLQSTFGSYTSARANQYAFERVEILKGPSSVLYGQGSTGGIVNLVSKRPEEEFGGEMLVEAGNYDRKVVAGDITGALDRDGEWLYRMVAYNRESDAQVDHTGDDSLLLMPSLSWRPTDSTEITLQGKYQDDSSGTTAAFLPWAGTVVPNGSGGRLDTETFISEPGWDKYDTEQKNVSLWIEHSFNDVWSLNASARYADGTVDYNSMWAVFAAPVRLDPNVRTAPRALYMSDADSEFLIYDIRATAQFDTGIVEHNVSFGIDSQDATTREDTLYTAGGTIDLYDPVYTGVPAGLDPERGPENTTEQLGVYIQNQMNIGNWIVNAGLRRDDTESQTEGSAAREDQATTMRFGLMYAFENGLHPYISYSESFEPVSGTDRFDQSYSPIEGEQWEAGVKYQPGGGNLLFTASAYEIVQNNRLTEDPVDPTEQTQTGEVTIDGVELELTGRWDNLNLIASYSRTNTEISESNVAGEQGQDIEAVPEQQFSLWGTWYFRDALDGLYAGLGVRHVGESFIDIPAQAAALGFPDTNPAYTLYDAALGYELENWDFRVNAKNLTDNVHTTSCLGRGDCFYGERRTVTAEARYRF